MGHVNKVSHVFTLSHVAEMLGEDEEWLFEVAEEMDTEDGQLWVIGVGEDGVMAFTDDGIENLKNLIQIHKDAPWIIEERRQVLAALATIAVAAPTVASAQGFSFRVGGDRDYYYRDRDDYRGPRAEYYEHDRGLHR